MQIEHAYDCTSEFVLFACQFTGKERDTESGLDYFGARYYGSSMGRWLSPDWSSSPSSVPYADMSDPQSLNLYAYLGNNPLGGADADGHVAPNISCKGGCPHVTLAQEWKAIKDLAIGGLKGLGRLAWSAATNPITGSIPMATPMPSALQYSNTDQSVGGLLAPIALSGYGGVADVMASAPAALETESVSSTALLSQAEGARDALATEVGASKATVTGAYNSETGQVTAAACGGGQCAEDIANGQLQGGATNFTKAIRPRTGNEVPICERCETTYGRDKFPPDAQFQSDTKPQQ